VSRGKVRFELLLGQVLAALPEPPARVVDAGGGTGQLAVALARRGYQVTVVDTSAAMLATCAQRAAGEGAEVAARLATVQGDAADLPALLGPASRDAAVCHDLITQVDDPAAVLAALAGVLCDGGVLSLGFANRDWLVLRAGRRGEHAGALRLAHGREAGRPPAPASVRRQRRRRPRPGRAHRPGGAGAPGRHQGALPVQRQNRPCGRPPQITSSRLDRIYSLTHGSGGFHGVIAEQQAVTRRRRRRGPRRPRPRDLP
jgi:SAM-dependent methyltransferase